MKKSPIICSFPHNPQYFAVDNYVDKVFKVDNVEIKESFPQLLGFVNRELFAYNAYFSSFQH